MFGVFAALLFSASAFAQKKSPGLQAVVISDGAAVYEKPDFDSKVIDFVPFETKVTISRKAYAGTEGLGLFHKVRVRGKIGYIPDTDIRLAGKDAEKEREKDKEKDKEKEKPAEPAKVKVAQDHKPKSKAFDKEEDESAPGRSPIYLTRFLGAAVSRVHFTETFEGRKLSDQILMYGLRMTGPGTLFDGPPLDVNVWFSLDKPGYYDIFSSNINGFLMFGDVMAQLPLFSSENWAITYGLGVMWSFTRYRVQIQGENTDSSDFRIGLDTGLGLAFRIGKAYALRADAKYYYERNHYAGYGLSFQMEY